jgi:hypothetical protein
VTFDTEEPENTVDLQMKQMLWVKKVKCFYGLENTSGYIDRKWGISQSECAGLAHRRSGRIFMKFGPPVVLTFHHLLLPVGPFSSSI